jgi:hypothetical protein
MKNTCKFAIMKSKNKRTALPLTATDDNEYFLEEYM